MPLQTTGSISISQIRAQFGSGAAPHAISEYYSDAASGFVPALTQGVNGPIPTTGNTIKLSDFYGAPGPFNMTLIVGSSVVPRNPSNDQAGYRDTLFGSLTGSTVTPYGTITGIFSTYVAPTGGPGIGAEGVQRLNINGLADTVPSGSTITIGGTTYTFSIPPASFGGLGGGWAWFGDATFYGYSNGTSVPISIVFA